MSRKSWIAIILGLVLVLAVGSSALVFADDPPPEDCNVTITVRDTDGNLVSSPESIGKEADVTVDWHDHGGGSETKTTDDGAAVFTLKQHTHYDVEALVDDNGHHYWGDSHFHTGDNAELDIVVYMLQDNETDVRFSVSGPVGIRLEVQGSDHRHIPMEATEFEPVQFRVEVNNYDGGDEAPVIITAFTRDGDWDGSLVWNDPAEGQIALKFSTELGEDDWNSVGFMSQDGEAVTAVRPGDVGHLEKEFLIKGYVGEDTADKHGRVIFRAELVQ